MGLSGSWLEEEAKGSYLEPEVSAGQQRWRECLLGPSYQASIMERPLG